MSIRIVDVCKRYKNFVALDHVDLEIPEGRLVALLGPSGSGKTTLLRIIAGLDVPDHGEVLFEGQETTRVPLRERRVGFVFQHYALFRHMNVTENIAFPLTVRPRRARPSRRDIRARVDELMHLVQLENFADRFPHQLSGGQRQRVALARALAVEPRVLLLDEPFGALDAQVRKELRTWLRRLHERTGITGVFVTHDQEEAMEVADRVVVINQGRIEQEGTPEEVYDRPATPFVHRFLGQVNLFHGRMVDGQTRIGANVALPACGEQVFSHVYVRPHDIVVARTASPASPEPATVEAVFAAGPMVRIDLRHREQEPTIHAFLTRERHAELQLQAGEQVFFGITGYRVYPAS